MAQLVGVSIRDDGAGGADSSGGTGLTGLLDRVQALGGTIEVESLRGIGTQIHAELPSYSGWLQPQTTTQRGAEMEHG